MTYVKGPSLSLLKFTEDLVSNCCKNTTTYLSILCYWTGLNCIDSPSSGLYSKKWQYSWSTANIQNNLEGKEKTKKGWKRKPELSCWHHANFEHCDQSTSFDFYKWSYLGQVMHLCETSFSPMLNGVNNTHLLRFTVGISMKCIQST